MTTTTHPLIVHALDLTARLAADPALAWRLDGDPAAQAFHRALAAATDHAALRAFVEEPDRFEPEHVRFPALQRLAELVEPDAHLALTLHQLATWVSTVDVDEKYAWAERAAALAPDDRRIAWELLFARADADVASQLEVVERLARRRDPDAERARAYVLRTGDATELANRLVELTRAMSMPSAHEVFARLRPRRG